MNMVNTYVAGQPLQDTRHLVVGGTCDRRVEGVPLGIAGPKSGVKLVHPYLHPANDPIQNSKMA